MGVPQKAIIMFSFHREMEVGRILADLFERLLKTEGGRLLSGAAPRGPLEREVSRLLGNNGQ